MALFRGRDTRNTQGNGRGAPRSVGLLLKQRMIMERVTLWTKGKNRGPGSDINDIDVLESRTRRLNRTSTPFAQTRGAGDDIAIAIPQPSTHRLSRTNTVPTRNPNSVSVITIVKQTTHHQLKMDTTQIPKGTTIA